MYDRLKERDEPGAVPQLIRALKSPDLNVINRAAWALGNLGAAEAVPKLIPVLVSTDMQIVMVSARRPHPSRGIAAWSPLGVTKNGNVAVLTPPVVSNGVVAYGAAVVPYGDVRGRLRSTSSTPPGTRPWRPLLTGTSRSSKHSKN